MHKCASCSQKFEIKESDLKFYEDIAPVFNGKKYIIPAPNLCPIDRQRQRLAFRNLRNLYYRKCDLTGEKILSCYDENTIQPVYNSKDWWSDKWDPLKYGREYDFSRTFFEQFEELYKEVPVLHHYVINSENCDYMNGAANCKDCYLCFNMDFCEKCYYLSDAKYCTSTVDCYGMVKSELCYECVNCENCYNLKYSTRCVSCSDSFFLSDCRQCKNCIGCCNLVGKKYYIFNQKVNKEEFDKTKEQFKTLEGVEKFKQEFKTFSLKYPKKNYSGHSNENFSGNDTHNAKNCHRCFNTFEVENCNYCYYIFKSNNCMDYDIFGGNSEWIYNCMAVGNNCSNNICCIGTWNGSSNNLYCNLMGGSSNNFGCCGLKHKQFCILNKQYSKEDYEVIVPKIIDQMKKDDEWGKFFPIHLSPFGYNETMANDFYPLSQKDAIAKGFKWKNLEDKTNKDFKIIDQERKFYEQNEIPIPIKHPELRHQERFAKRNPLILWDRTCNKCNVEIKTSYSPDRPENIYCEKCYLEEIY